MILALSIAGIALATLPAALFLANLPLFRFQSHRDSDDLDSAPRLSVLIPARNEAGGIGSTLEAATASRGVTIEVIVLDDDSDDATAEIVNRYGESDSRVRCIRGAPLPPGWNGKQHACWQLAESAIHDRLVFLDADVRLRPDALAQLVHHQDRHGIALLSVFPHQETGTWMEAWIIPMIHFILLGFLPLSRMRSSTHPAYAAGCGQLFMTRKDDYVRAGTHREIRHSRHDGVKLPRLYRQADLTTDVFDGTDLADCRMYHSTGEVIRGVLKNAIEGIANPRVILPFSVLLIGGSVMPVMTLIWGIGSGNLLAACVSLVGVIVGHLPRALGAWHFRQPLMGVLFHGPATLLFVGLQWIALVNHLLGRQIAWRGRTEAS